MMEILRLAPRHTRVAAVLALTLASTTLPAVPGPIPQEGKDPQDGEDIEIFNTEKGQEPFLSAEDARKSISLPPGFSASVFAAEPDVRQPIAMAFDTRGRLWVAENYTYAEREVNFEMRLHDRILIFEDRDHDGRFDDRKVFWDRAQKLTSVEVGFGGVWALCAPQLLFLPDRDGDDVPDGEPRVVLDGWDDGEVRHNMVNGLRWGPDGWLYGRHGIQETSRVGRPGTPADRRTELNCSIWRFHPVREEFEVVVHGTTNPWGHDWDDHGQLFFINTVIGHLWHVIPGAHYERMYGQDFNPHLYELMPQTADHFHWDRREAWSDLKKNGLSETTSQAGGGHAHSGLMVYLGDNWPEEYRNDVFAVNYHGRRVNRDRLERRGVGYTATHRPDMLKVGDVWFRGLDLIYGPDGGVYLSDWSDIGECHDTDGVHRTSGRIYKITHGEPAAPEIGDLEKRSDAELVRLQLHRNDWWVRQARRILQERAAAGKDMTETDAALRKLFEEQRDVTRKLRALWSLHVIGAADEAWLTELLAHEEEHVRVWAVKLLVDRPEPKKSVVTALTALARKEKSGLVQLFLASALQRLAHADRWDIAEALASRDTFAGDPVLPRMIWYGVEPAVVDFPARAAALIRKSRLPRLRRFITRRLVEDAAARTARSQWSVEKAREWYARQPWLVGCNFSPSTAINQLEMWQAETFDRETIRRELGWARKLGFNTIRVYLHDLLWTQGTGSFLNRIDRFLAICEQQEIRVMFVLLDGVWDPFPVAGKQRAPKPHVHNSGWVQSPGVKILSDPAKHDSLKAYVKGVIGRFHDDPRVLAWDIFNEPDNTNRNSYGEHEPEDKEKLALMLLKKAYGWAREARPEQPITSAVWHGNWGDPAKLKPIDRFMLTESDIITFHNYSGADAVARSLEDLRAHERPILCTEYMARPNGSTFMSVLPVFKEAGVGALCWGFVSGKTQTIYPWDSWTKKYTAEPPLWFHDILRADGTPYRKDEVELLKRLTGRRTAER